MKEAAKFTRDQPVTKVVRRTRQWRDIPGYEGLYRVSDLGVVVAYPNTRHRGFAPLKPWLTNKGYPQVRLCRQGHRKNHSVHTLVLLAFRGPPPPGHVSRHRNGIRQQCHLGNLEYGTQSENLADMHRHGTARIGSKHHNAVHTEAEVLDIRAALRRGESPARLANAYRVTPENIYAIRDRITWRHV